MSHVFDISCEQNKSDGSVELDFPCLFPASIFGYSVQKDLKLSLVIHFNKRLLRYSQEFAAESYFFFAQNILQNVVLQQQINFAM